MDSMGSVTRCIRELEPGDQQDEGAGGRREEAFRLLLDRYQADLTRYALRRLRGMDGDRRIVDEEDAAARAFIKVCHGIESGRLKLAGREDLRRLLLWSTKCAVINQVNRQPGGGPPPVATARADGDPDGRDDGLARIPDPGGSPEFLVLAEEGCRRLLERLGDDTLRQIALWKLIGHTNQQIARRLGCSLSKVERKLVRIREKWATVAPAGITSRPGPRDASSVDADADGEPGGLTTIVRHLAGFLDLTQARASGAGDVKP